MKNLQNFDGRLTDALERELLQEAIDNQQSYAFDRAVGQLFRKLVSFFKVPEAHLPAHTARTAH